MNVRALTLNSKFNHIFYKDVKSFNDENIYYDSYNIILLSYSVLKQHDIW